MPLSDSDLLTLITPALPGALQKDLKTIKEANDAIREAKEAIRNSQFRIATKMHKETDGKSTESLPYGMVRPVEDEIRYQNRPRAVKKALVIKE